ncbi:hypothetical protein BDV95DRAFT_607741 [Massariosphaeria phaeospora]|uniref:Uncharacterized protein n=1 Tax=Massariosphaeria phaeospora TaxID=100035 RepID=A0A7C8MMI9_9PLEO|nr:hypothetical protein BDV95DRAFT_607741 [Massariosphaeria phaeospora]
MSEQAPPPRISSKYGPGGYLACYSYYDGTLHSNGIKLDAADEIRRRMRNYDDKKQPVTLKYMYAQCVLWGCFFHHPGGPDKTQMRVDLIEALNEGWCDYRSPFAIEFEDDMRR